MTDAVLTKPKGKTWDFGIAEDGGIDTESFFDTSMLTAIYEEKRASESEVPRPELRRGWIGNESLSFERGSKIWLYHQARVNRTTINGINNEANKSFTEQLVDPGYALSVSTDVIVSRDKLTLLAEIQRPDGQIIQRLLPLWDRSGVTETG